MFLYIFIHNFIHIHYYRSYNFTIDFPVTQEVLLLTRTEVLLNKRGNNRGRSPEKRRDYHCEYVRIKNAVTNNYVLPLIII